MKAVVFDLDGTLLDTLDDLADAVNAALEASGLPARALDEVRVRVGNGIANLMLRAMPGVDADAVVEDIADDAEKLRRHKKLLTDFRAYYDAHCEDKTLPYEGVEHMLSELKSKHIKTAVVSNKADFAVSKLCENYFGNLIDAAVGENEGGGLHHQAAGLGDCHKEAVYVGDSEVDIETAANSGMRCISVLWGFKSREFLIMHGAETLVKNNDELLVELLT